MCTVSFIPAAEGGGYLLATSRDERPTREVALPPRLIEGGGREVLAPRDPQGGGSWLALDERGCAMTLLNGEEPDAPRDVEPPSRGALLLALMRGDEDPVAALERRKAEGRLLERPFRLLVAESGREGQPARLRRLAWDGQRLGADVLAGPHLETSSGDDPEGVRAKRRASFERFLRSRSGPVSEPMADLRDDLLAWHGHHFGEEPEGGILSPCMHAPGAATVSLSSVLVGKSTREMTYQAGSPCLGRPTSLHFIQGCE